MNNISINDATVINDIDEFESIRGKSNSPVFAIARLLKSHPGGLVRVAHVMTMPDGTQVESAILGIKKYTVDANGVTTEIDQHNKLLIL